jgi:Ca2+-binding RTX toxin-like protein
MRFLSRARRVQQEQRRRQLSCEFLEQRQVMAATLTASLVGTELRIEGTPRNDDILVSQSRGFYTIRGLSQRFAVGTVSSITVLGLEGNDRLTAPSRLAAGTNLTVTLDGGPGRDTLTGSPAADLLRGGEGNDSLTGGDGNDQLFGDAGTDRLIGGNGNDVLDGGADADSLSGDAGDDLLLGGGGDDAISGGSGNDRYQFNADESLGTDTLTESPGGIEVLDFSPTQSQPVRINLGSATTQVINSNLALNLRSGSDYEQVVGGGGNDVLTGNAGANRLDGAAGNDILLGLDGADELIGGSGNDTYLFDADSPLGTDILQDVDGIDTLDFSATTTKSININTGFFSAQALNANITVLLTNNQNFENVIGTPLNDLFISGPANNTFQGGAGSDVYRFDADGPLGADMILDSDGANDFVDFSPTTTVGLTLDFSLTTAQLVTSNLTLTIGAGTILEDLLGGSLNDQLTGNAANNSIGGGSGDDTLAGLSGNDSLFGGLGDDTYLFDTDNPLGADTINEASNSGLDTVDFSATENQVIAFNFGQATAQTINANLSLTFSAATVIERVVGGSLDDTLIGNNLANHLVGGPGADLLQGLAGNDLLEGGAGDDTYLFDADSALGTVTIFDVSGVDTLDLSATTTLSVSVDLASLDDQTVNRNLRLSLPGQDDLENVIGTPLNDVLLGNRRDNLLRGGAGSDTYGFITNTFQGTDTIDDSSGTADSLNYAPTNTQTVTIDLGLATAQVVNTNHRLILGSSTAIENVVGGELGDTLIGNSLNNTLSGGPGADSLIGLTGNDTLIGGDGNDRYFFNTDTPLGADRVDDTQGGSDTLDFSATTTLPIVVNLGLTTAQVVNSNLTLTLASATGTENILGTALNDQLIGNASANSLQGSGGNDQLQGLGGNDSLNGGLGDDIYFFNTNSSLGTDTLTDAGGTDLLDFSSSTTMGVAVNLSATSNQTVNSNLILNLGTTAVFENVHGTSLNDTLTSNRLSNYLRGGLGDDTYRFDVDTYQDVDFIQESGTGNDTIDFSLTTTVGVTFSLSQDGLQVVNANLTVDLVDSSNFENLIGGSLADSLTGNARKNVLTGNGGDDLLVGLAGDDSLIGGLGNDRYLFNTDTNLDTDSISDTSGTGDTLDFSTGTLLPIAVNLSQTTAQVINSNLSLILTANDQLENVVGSPLNDTILGNTNANNLSGGAGNDSLSGLGGSDTLNGGEGDDTYRFGTNTALGSETINDSAGMDTLDFSDSTLLGVAVNLSQTTAQTVNANLGLTLTASSLIENVIGTNNNDTLVGNQADNVLMGGLGNDTYRFNVGSAQGRDRLVEAGSGNDTLDFSLTTSVPVTFSLLSSGIQVINANLTIDLGTDLSFENLTGGSLNDNLTGNDAANVINGGAGDDVITGLGGDDQLIGGTGNDRFVFDTDTDLGTDSVTETASGGTDTLDFSSTLLLPVTMDLSQAAPQTVNANLQLTLGAGNVLENILGTPLNDLLTGNGNANSLSGLEGDDTLIGLAGNDTLNGGAGDDLYIFNTDTALGSDTLTDSAGTDLLDFSRSTTLGVSLNLATTVAQVVNSNLSLNLGTNVSFENVYGTSLNDTFTSNRLNNLLRGGAGNDTYRFDVDTLQGTDQLDEAAGGNDTIDFSLTTTVAITFSLASDGSQVVHSNLTINVGLGSDFENLTGGSLADLLTGNTNDNQLTGGSGDDQLVGLQGQDLLIGSSGNDTLNGGDGDDTYLFNTDSALGTDTLVDNSGQDWLDFSRSSTTGVSVDLGSTSLQTVNAQLKLILGSATPIEHIVGTPLADTLQGNSLDNVLLGGAGNDVLAGGAGRDILVGGSGSDQLSGDSADDILIGGLQTYQDEAAGTVSRASYQSLIAEWQRTDLVFAARIGNLRVVSVSAGGTGAADNSLPPGLNGTALLDTTTCLDDAAVDTLLGGDELDWFWRFGEDLVSDLDEANEQLN